MLLTGDPSTRSVPTHRSSALATTQGTPPRERANSPRSLRASVREASVRRQTSYAVRPSGSAWKTSTSVVWVLASEAPTPGERAGSAFQAGAGRDHDERKVGVLNPCRLAVSDFRLPNLVSRFRLVKKFLRVVAFFPMKRKPKDTARATRGSRSKAKGRPSKVRASKTGRKKGRIDGRTRVSPARRRHLARISKLGGKARARRLSRRRLQEIARLGGTRSAIVRGYRKAA